MIRTPRLAVTVAVLSLSGLAAAPAAAFTFGKPAPKPPALKPDDPSLIGRWSALEPYPVVPVSAALMPNGKIVAWDQADPWEPINIVPNSGAAMILDPQTGSITRSHNLAPESVFCPLIATLPNGKVVIAGGGNLITPASTRTLMYDPDTNTFGSWSTMSVGRWYGGGTITSTGDVVVLGGTWKSGADVISAGTGRNRRLEVSFGNDAYPIVMRMPDGRLTVENVTDVKDQVPTRRILNLSGSGSFADPGNLTLLKHRLRMASTMVGPYQMLGIGGGLLKEAYLLDVSSGQPVAKPAGTVKDLHITGTAVTLPDGSAVVIGGNSKGDPIAGPPTLGVELWSPTTNQWTSMAASPAQRQYHSVSALLPDGRVWSAGTAIQTSNRVERNGAYFSPPYLFKKDGSGQLAPRPQITSAPSSAAWGQTIVLRSPQAASIRRASLVRMASTTHQIDFSGAFIPVGVSVSGDRVSLKIPNDGNAVPAGHYMVFLLDSAGVPSKAATVRIDPPNSTPRPTAISSSQADDAFPGHKGYDGDTANLGVATRFEPSPWWTIDLGRSYPVTGLRIHNRTDSYDLQQRLRSTWVFWSDTPFTSTHFYSTRFQPGVSADLLPEDYVGPTVDLKRTRTARYIRIQKPTAGILNFREVTIYTTDGKVLDLAR